MRGRLMPFVVAAGVLAAAAVALRVLPMTRTVTDANAGRDAVPQAADAAADTLALPPLAVGESVAELGAALDRAPAPRRLDAPAPGMEAWEWSEPAGRYALAQFSGGRLVAGMVQRPWVGHLPAVEAARLGTVHAGATREDVDRALGPGWPVQRTVGPEPFGDVITLAWSIRDRGLDTGAVLRIGFRDDRAVAIEHPWSAR